MSQTTSEAGPVICLMGELDLPPFVDRKRIDGQTSNHRTPTEGENESPRPQLLLWSELALHHKLIAPFDDDSEWVGELPQDLTDLMLGELPAYARYVRRCLLKTSADLDAVVVIGCERLEPGSDAWRRFNSVACVDPTDESITYYDKKNLVPWSEFLPYATGSVGAATSSYRHGDAPGVFRAACGTQTYQFRAAICYDLCFSEHFRPTADEDNKLSQADFFVQCGSEGQDQTGTLSKVMFRMAQMRAIESRRAIVRNVNLGYSALIDSRGLPRYVIGRQPITDPVILPAVPIDRRVSVYATWGDAPLTWFCATIGALVCLRRGAKRIGISCGRPEWPSNERRPD